MELKSIFQMTKTDRYTQDGRDELAKLQETEDVKYKTGDISQKTGLQKQPDGSWAPPKHGAHPKMGSPEYNEKYGLTKRDVATGKEIDRIYEKQQKRIKELKAKGYTDEQIENDKIYQQTKEDMRNVGKSKPAAKKEAGSINRTPERIAKETAIMEALNLSTGEDNNLHKMSDETIERLYARTQEKPAAGKTTIRQGPNTKTLNETPAEHIKKNLDAYTGNSAYDMEELVLKPSGYKRQTSARIPSGGQSITYTKEGEEDITLFFDKDGELENSDVSAANKPDTEKQVSVLMEKYKDLPSAQKKDALYAATFEGSPIGMTQNQMERQGWDLVQADDDVNVYAKPDGSKVTMKHDGNKITSTEYEAPKKEIKTNGLTPAEKFNSQETAKTINAATNDYKQRDKMLTEKANKEFGTKGNNPVEVAGELLINIRKAKPHSDEWYIAMDKYDTFSDTYRSTNGSDALDYYNSQFDKLLMTPNWNKEKLTDAAPKIRQLTGDCRIRIRKEKPKLTGDTKIRIRK